MKSERLIHIKFEYDGALEAKRDILASEIDLIRISKRLKKYLEYRDQELSIKIDVDRKLRALKLDIGRLQNLLPPVEIPSILKQAKIKAKRIEKEEIEKEEIPEKVVKNIEEENDDLEMQLQDIQRRLNSIS